MNDFPEFDSESMGGCESFQFASNKNVQLIPAAINNVISSEVIFAGANVFLNGLAIRDTLLFDEKQTQTAGGEVYTPVITGMVPKLTAVYLDQFTKMTKERFIVSVKDNNGNQRLSGTIRAGMKFTFDQSTSQTPDGLNGFKFQFSMDYPKPSPFYIG